MPFRLLVVNPDDETRTTVEQALAAAGHLVNGVADYEEGRDRLLFAPPDLLVTSLKLGWYNGLQLVIRAHADNPTMPAIVVHEDYDPVLEREAADAGAVYLSRAQPVDSASLLKLVEQLLANRRPHVTSTLERAWPRKHASVPVKAGGDDARLVDVSYGGVRLELSGVPNELSRIASVYIPGFGMLPVHLVWARGGAGAAGRWWCGAQVNAGDDRTEDAWRRFVDSLN